MQKLCTSRNGKEIVYQPDGSHAATHFADTPELKGAVIEALSVTDVAGDSMFFEHNLGRVIGLTDLVETSDGDEIIYAKRKDRDVYTRFTVSQKPHECSTVTVALNKQSENTYLLWSAWVGYIGPAFPGDQNETSDSMEYWSNHALVWGRQEVQAGTETAENPWQ